MRALEGLDREAQLRVLTFGRSREVMMMIRVVSASGRGTPHRVFA